MRLKVFGVATKAKVREKIAMEDLREEKGQGPKVLWEMEVSFPGKECVETSAGPRKSNAGKGTPRPRQVKAGSVPWMDQGALWPGCRMWGWWKTRMESKQEPGPCS